jgi:hypothetical protein
MAISAWRGPTVLGFALAMQLVAWPAFAECGNGSGMTGDASLAAILKPGDAISVTPWSGRKQSGQVTAITDCSLALRTEKHSVEMPFASIKTVRRHQHQTVNPGAATVMNVANQCEDISCTHVALAFVGVAAAIQGFDRLVHPPQVIYRAKKPPVARDQLPR